MLILDSKLIQDARSADMLTFLEKRSGFTFAHRGSGYRCRQHPSLTVKDDRLSWYWHSQGIGGYGALDYLMKMELLPFRQAVETVVGVDVVTAQPQQEHEQSRTLFLPEKRWNSLRLYAYLCQNRGIHSSIVNALIQDGKLYEDKRGNVVFVGFDEQGQARFASLRGTYGDGSFRMDCAGSDKRYGFCMAACVPSERLYIFESPIDAMSHASLETAIDGDRDAWRRDNRLSLAGTSDTALPLFLNQYPAVNELVFCLDNDRAGRDAAVTLARTYSDKGLHTRMELPSGKDFNEDLVTLLAERASCRRSICPPEK